MRLIWLDYLRVIAIFAVVCTHVSAIYYHSFSEVSRPEWWFANIINASSRFAVPAFLMISGCVLLGRSYSTVEFYRKRFIRIGPPLLFWTIFFAVVNFHIYGLPGFISPNQGQDSGWTYHILDMSLLFLITGSTSPHLWYLSMLACLLLFVPLLNKLVLGERLGVADLVLIASLGALFTCLKLIANIVHTLGGPTIDWFTVFPWYILYFVLGFLIFQHHRHLKIRLSIVVVFAGIALVVGLISNFLVVTKNSLLIDWLFFANDGLVTFALSLSLFYIFIKVADRLHGHQLVFLLSEASFGIYLVHPVFIVLLQKLIPNHIDSAWLYLPLIIFVTFGLSFLTTLGMRKNRWLRRVC